MIDGDSFIEIAKNYFGFLTIDFGYKVLPEKIVGNFFYTIEYSSDEKIISISYENAEDYLLVVIYLLQDGVMPKYNDQKKMLYLHKLNNAIHHFQSSEYIHSNNDYFGHHKANTGLEKRMLDSAKKITTIFIKPSLTLSSNYGGHFLSANVIYCFPPLPPKR